MAGHYDVVKSLRNGRRTSENIREALARAGLRLADFGEILDFGPLSDAERTTFLRGELVVRNGELSGRNACAVYHPAEYVKAQLADGFTVVEHIPEGATGTGRQDIYLLKKSAAD